MNESELSAKAEKLTIMGEYSEAELRRRLADEVDIETFEETIGWFMFHTIGRRDLSPFEWMIWDRIFTAIVNYWDPRSLGCPI